MVIRFILKGLFYRKIKFMICIKDPVQICYFYIRISRMVFRLVNRSVRIFKIRTNLCANGFKLKNEIIKRNKLKNTF
jgi:hypothetical protein